MGVAARLVRQALAKGKTISCFRVVTDSMSPVIPVGATIEVAPLPAEGVRALKTFDIVLTETDDRLYCHYLASVNEFPKPDGTLLCVTRGLNNIQEDIPVPDSQVLGCVVSHRIPLRYKVRIAARILTHSLAHRICGGLI